MLRKLYTTPERSDEDGRWFQRLSQASVLSSGVIWAVGSQQIISSSDAGRTVMNYFDRLPAKAAMIPWRLVSRDERHACVLALFSNPQMKVVCTHDGGLSWSPISVPGDLHPVTGCFLSASNVWLVAGDVEIPPETKILQTTSDMGEHWEIFPLDVEGEPSLIRFFDLKQGLLLVDRLLRRDNRFVTDVYVSENGGQSWRLKYSFDEQISDLWSFSQFHWFVVGEAGLLAESSDGGTTWSSVRDTTASDLNAIAFLNPALGGAVGDGATVLLSRDGGKSWIRMVIPQLDSHLIATGFVSERELIVVAEDSIWSVDV